MVETTDFDTVASGKAAAIVAVTRVGALTVRPAALDQVLRDLGEDALAPPGYVEVGLSEPQEGVPQRRRREHVGVENSLKAHRRCSLRVAEDAAVQR